MGDFARGWRAISCSSNARNSVTQAFPHEKNHKTCFCFWLKHAMVRKPIIKLRNLPALMGGFRMGFSFAVACGVLDACRCRTAPLIRPCLGSLPGFFMLRLSPLAETVRGGAFSALALARRSFLSKRHLEGTAWACRPGALSCGAPVRGGAFRIRSKGVGAAASSFAPIPTRRGGACFVSLSLGGWL